MQWAVTLRANLLILGQAVLHPLYREVLEYSFTMAALLTAAIADLLERRLRLRWSGLRFGFVEEPERESLV